MNASAGDAGSALVPLPVVVPLVGAALVGMLRRFLNRTFTDLLGLMFSGVTLFTAALLVHRVLSGPVEYWFGGWAPRGSTVLGIAFTAEPIGASLALLAAILTFLALLSGWRDLDSGANHFQPLMLIFLGAMSGFVLTADLFNLFVFFELMSIAAFALCGLKTAEPAPLQGSFNFAITNSIAAFLLLTGIAMLYAAMGALNMAQVGMLIAGRHDPLVLFAYTLLVCGFLVKAAIVPFHLWLPDAHAVAPTPVCVLFSGLMVELGLYAILRLHIVVFGQAVGAIQGRERALLMGFAALTIIVGAVMCYGEHHLKRLLAYSTISHAGLLLLCCSIGGPVGVASMLLYLAAHAFVKSSLFFTSGLLLQRLRTISERSLFQKAQGMPGLAVLWFAGGAGLAATPGFATCFGASLASRAASETGLPRWVVPCLFVLSGTLTAAAVLRVGAHTFLGWGSEPISDEAADVGEAPEDLDSSLHWYGIVPPVVCIALSVSLPFMPGLAQTLAHASAQMSSQAAYLHTAYTGRELPLPTPMVSVSDDFRSATDGTFALLLAVLLAATSVFRLRLPRWARAGAYLEHGSRTLRGWQSGHPGDYVFWLITGVAVFGGVALFLLRG